MGKHCVIFAGGDMQEISLDKAVSIRNESELIICADSGLKHALKYNISPDIIVGDFDSYTAELPKTPQIIRSIPEKDDTDTLLAVRKAIELGCNSIDLYGALGGSRFEHTVANLQTMMFAREHGCKLNICGESLLMLQTADDNTKFYRKSEKNCYFSFFAVTPQIHVDFLRGAKYPLENCEISNSFPIGVSNEFSSECIEFKISDGTALVILTPM